MSLRSRFRAICNRFWLSHLLKGKAMDAEVAISAEKTLEEEPSAKKPKIEPSETEVVGRLKGKKMALFISYIGQGYSGMQKNEGVKTIEEDLLNALLKSEAITEDHRNHTEKMKFQRCSRTDKGVSAALNVVTLKMAMTESRFQELSVLLPDPIKAIGFMRTTRSFDAKAACTGRLYEYLTPTFAFAPTYAKTRRDFRMSAEVLERVCGLLAQFKGTHKFHNFTSGKKATDAESQRYITEFTCGEPFLRSNSEFVSISVKGQSFLLHQIRKMIGLVIAVAQGRAGEGAIERAWKVEKMDIPKAPALGLFLNRPFFDYYNKRYGGDGLHQPILWDPYEEKIQAFKEKIFNVIVEKERADNSMMNWLSTLEFHTYNEERMAPLPGKEESKGSEGEAEIKLPDQNLEPEKKDDCSAEVAPHVEMQSA